MRLVTECSRLGTRRFASGKRYIESGVSQVAQVRTYDRDGRRKLGELDDEDECEKDPGLKEDQDRRRLVENRNLIE